MAFTSIPQSDETWDAFYSLRTTVRRQAQQLQVQQDALTDLTVKVANLTAAVAAILEYCNPEAGEWVCMDDGPPEYEEYTVQPKTYADYTRLLFEVPAEVRNGR